MSEFDESPRTSKRQKISTYGLNSSTSKRANLKPPSVLRSLSGAVSGLSRRLFEPETERASPTQAVNGADGSQPTNRSSQEDEEQAGQVRHDTDAVSGRAVTNQKEVAEQEGVGGLVKSTGNANGRSKGSTGAGGSGGSGGSSAHKTRSTEETTAKGSRSKMPTSSSRKRDMRNHADEGEIPEVRSAGAAPKASSSHKSATLTPQGEANTRASISHIAEDEPGILTATDDDGTTALFTQRSSGREKRRPRRYSAEIEDTAKQRRKRLVGSATPSKRDKTRTKKLVTSKGREEAVDDQLKFRDIGHPRHATDIAKQKGRATRSDLEIARDVEPLVQAGGGDEPDSDSLAMADAALPDITPLLDFSSNTTPPFNALPAAEEDPYLTAIKAKVISRLTNSSLVPLANLATEYVKIHSLLKATVSAGEGNSILVLGARGSGKTNLIETALSDISHEYADDFHVVRLSGFQQTDDKIALREIWRQLGREMHVEEDETNQVSSSYADTMASLLHLLSHPEELAVVLESDARATTTKSVILVMDEFDLFATHPRQTLLYNLFDIAQAKKAPIAVIGCSTRVDVAESLEKRVKSRFSHRWVHLSLPKSYQAFEAVIEAALCLETAEGDVMDEAQSSWQAAWNRYMKVGLLLSVLSACTVLTLNKATVIPSPSVQTLLRQVFYTTKSIPAAFSLLYIPITSIASLERPFKAPLSFASLTPPESVLQLLPSLSPLHFCLLISAARLDAIYNASVVNFNLVYHHYVELASRLRLQSSASGALAQGGVTKIWGREVAKGAWEELGHWEVLMPATLAKGKGEEAPDTKMWRVDVTLEELGTCVSDAGPGVSEVLSKWCKEV